MNNNDLIEACKPIETKERIVFHSNVQYGFSKIIRKMAYYPSFLPICAYFEHSSPPFYDEMWEIKNEFLSDIFFHREQFANQWNNKFDGVARTFKSPFVWYKEKNKIKVSEKAKGSIFFIHHTREGVEREHNKRKIIETINNLDDCFKPVTFCFYYLDVLNELHLPYQELGFNIVTVGNKSNPDFIQNFEGSRIRLIKSKTYQEAKELFLGKHTQVSKEQLFFANRMLGVHKNTSRFNLSIILYKSLFLYAIFKIKKKIKQSK